MSIDQGPKEMDPVPGRAVSATPLGYESRRVGRVDAGSLVFPDRVRDLYVPAGLVLAGWAGGVMLLVTQAGAGLAGAAGVVTAYLIVKLVIMVVATPLLVRLGGISFGPLAPAALKMTAIAIVPDVVALTVATVVAMCVGVVFALTLGFVALWVMFSRLFELETQEAGLCSAVYAGIGIGFMVAWWQLFAWLLAIAPR